MSFASNWKRIKNANKRAKYAVYGYIHRYQPLLPTPIFDVILCFYQYDEWDKENIGPQLHLDKDCVKVGPSNSYVCGSAFLKNVVSDGIFSWKFRIVNMCDELNFGIWKTKTGRILIIKNGRYFHGRNSAYVY
eukprot:422720_1